MTGMSLCGGERALADVDLSVMSRTNLRGIVSGLVFLSSITSSMCPTLMEEMGTEAMESEFGVRVFPTNWLLCISSLHPLNQVCIYSEN